MPPAKKESEIWGGKSKWHWTNERHVHFLNSMEESFVQSMFGDGDPPPLDRYLPDKAESTQDPMERRRAIRQIPSPSPSGSSKEKTDKKTRLLSCQKSSQDQVVPQIQNDDHVPPPKA